MKQSKIQKMPMRDYIKDTLKYSPVLAISALVALLVIPVITRLFLPQEYGRYALVMVVVLLSSNFTGSIAYSIILRYLPKYSMEGKGYQVGHLVLSIFVVLSVLIGFLSWLFFYFAGEAISYELRKLFVLGFFTYICTVIFRIMLQVWRSQRKITLYSIFYTAQIIGGIGIGLLLAIKFKFGVAALLWGNIAISLFLLVPTLSVNSWFFFRRPKLIPVQEARSAFLYGFFSMVTGIILWVIASSDRLIIGLFRGADDVGIYAISYDFAEKAMFIIISLFLFVYKPMVINLWETKGEEAVRFFNYRVVKIFITICTPIALILSLLSGRLALFLFSPQYLSGSPVIPFVIMGLFVYGLTELMTTPLVLHKKTQFIAGSMAIAAVLNFSLNILLIPKFGLLAAAITTSIAYLVNFLAQRRFSLRYLRLELPYRTLKKVLIASSLMCAGVSFANRNMINQNGSQFISLAVLSLVGISIYAAALFLTGHFKDLHLNLGKEYCRE